MQLEAFRRQKAEKKQPNKAAVSDEAPSKPADLSKPSKAASGPVDLPASTDRGFSEQQNGAPPSHGITATLPASGHGQAPSAAQNGHATGSSPQQPVEPAASEVRDSAPAEAVSVGSEVPAARQRTARSLFSGGLPAPPPLPLPPTPNSRYHAPASPPEELTKIPYNSAVVTQHPTLIMRALMHHKVYRMHVSKHRVDFAAAACPASDAHRSSQARD